MHQSEGCARWDMPISIGTYLFAQAVFTLTQKSRKANSMCNHFLNNTNITTIRNILDFYLLAFQFWSFVATISVSSSQKYSRLILNAHWNRVGLPESVRELKTPIPTVHTCSHRSAFKIKTGANTTPGGIRANTQTHLLAWLIGWRHDHRVTDGESDEEVEDVTQVRRDLAQELTVEAHELHLTAALVHLIHQLRIWSDVFLLQHHTIHYIRTFQNTHATMGIVISHDDTLAVYAN